MSDFVLQRMASGDASAVRECMDRYGGLVWSLARRWNPGNKQESEDAVQEIFVDLWKSATRFDPAIAREATFVAMIARRRLIDRRRRAERRPRLEALGEAETRAEPSGAAAVEASAEAKRVTRQMESLRPEVRQVLELATIRGLSHGEIARETGLPLGTVKSHARRGLERLRNALSGEGKA